MPARCRRMGPSSQPPAKGKPIVTSQRKRTAKQWNTPTARSYGSFYEVTQQSCTLPVPKFPGSGDVCFASQITALSA